jgi:Xaa-Pro aminopeptidase
LRLHPETWAGVSAKAKISEIRKELADKKADALVVSPLDEVAWLFNVRGGDLDFNPVALGYGLITRESATLYVDERKVSEELRSSLLESGVAVSAYETCFDDVRALASDGATLWVDPEKVSAALVAAAEEAAAEAHPKKKTKTGADDETKPKDSKPTCILEGASPIPLAKALKNPSELAGMMEAHLRDGVAMASFWCWLDRQVAENKITEYDEFEIGEVVRSFRQKQVGFSEESFATIAGEGPHGAIIHYRASKESARTITADSLLLCDSGGQYECGTTDVTRTHHTGTPTRFQKEAYTRVLQGHIALASCRFPEDTSGFVLDVFARSHLWANGLDYRHGTGHGVGAALNVHEGPQSVSPRFGNPTPLRPGMVLSNEPGYYQDGGFGIRIENLLVVREAATEHAFGEKKYLEFYPLTHIPIQKKLIDWELMSQKDVAWLNEYHEQVWAKVAPRISADAEDSEAVLAWLKDATKPVKVEKVTVVVD